MQTKPEVKEKENPEEKQYIQGFYRRLQNGDTAFIGAADKDQNLFQITFTQHKHNDPFNLEPPIQTTLVMRRELFDALISTYFEEYTREDCEAVLIQKLSNKRGFNIELVPEEKMPKV